MQNNQNLKFFEYTAINVIDGEMTYNYSELKPQEAIVNREIELPFKLPKHIANKITDSWLLGHLVLLPFNELNERRVELAEIQRELNLSNESRHAELLAKKENLELTIAQYHEICKDIENRTTYIYGDNISKLAERGSLMAHIMVLQSELPAIEYKLSLNDDELDDYLWKEKRIAKDKIKTAEKYYSDLNLLLSDNAKMTVAFKQLEKVFKNDSEEEKQKKYAKFVYAACYAKAYLDNEAFTYYREELNKAEIIKSEIAQKANELAALLRKAESHGSFDNNFWHIANLLNMAIPGQDFKKQSWKDKKRDFLFTIDDVTTSHKPHDYPQIFNYLII